MDWLCVSDSRYFKNILSHTCQVCVIVRTDDIAGKRLVGYIVPQCPDNPPAVSELRARLNSHLPSYMVPSAFVILNAMPLTPNGKVDKRALPKPSDTAGMCVRLVQNAKMRNKICVNVIIG